MTTPTSPPARPARSRYDRPRRAFSPLAVIVGLILGIGAGLFYAWMIAPVVRENVEPWQLDLEGREAWTAAIALAYAQDGDLGRAVDRLVGLRFPGDPIQGVADTACRIASTGGANSTTGLNTVRAMMRLYQPQGRTGCADTLLALDALNAAVVEITVAAPTPTLTPPPSKTPEPISTRPSPTPVAIIPTAIPQNDFILVGVTTTCSTSASGVIVVEVYESNGGTGVPAVEVRARWNGGESRFFTGLHPGRSPAYSDFQMEPGVDYLIDLPGRADPIAQPLSAVPCTTPAGERAVIGYRVVFRRG
jgi:hypothetical protein